MPGSRNCPKFSLIVSHSPTCNRYYWRYMHGEQRNVTRKRYSTTISQTGSPGPPPRIPHASLNGTGSHSRRYQESFKPSNSHRSARLEQVPYYLRLVRTGPFRLSEIRRLSPTRRTCSRLNARFDAANRKISPRSMQPRYILHRVTAFLGARRSASVQVSCSTSDYFPYAVQVATQAIFNLRPKRCVSTSDSSLRRSRGF